MRTRLGVIAVLLLGFVAAGVHASGRAGIYGVIERVVLEPNDGAPERAQIWGAFALIERTSSMYGAGTEVQGQMFTNYLYERPARGYLYFTLPQTSADSAIAKREWADLVAVAGKREAVAFGMWDRFRGDDKLMRIRGANETPQNPDVYLSNVGVARLGSAGNHASIVAELLKLVR
jgi:hypothetical protein